MRRGGASTRAFRVHTHVNTFSPRHKANDPAACSEAVKNCPENLKLLFEQIVERGLSAKRGTRACSEFADRLQPLGTSEPIS